MAKRDRTENDGRITKKRSKKETTTTNDFGSPSQSTPLNKSSSYRSMMMGSPSNNNNNNMPSKLKKSIFLKKKIDIDLSLLPSSLHNTDDAVQNSLNQLLMKYSDGLGGIMLACENVRIKTDGRGEGSGWILNELPWIHYTVSCDALVFRPFIGCQVSLFCFPKNRHLLKVSLQWNVSASKGNQSSTIIPSPPSPSSYMVSSMNVFLPIWVC